MKLFALSHIGQFHINHNEDFLTSVDLGNNRRLIAVMDGCSSGTDSHLASTLIGKLLRKIGKQIGYKAFIEKKDLPLSQLIEDVSLTLFDELHHINRYLDLRSDEILSTLILGIIDEVKYSGEFVIIGDGIIHVNGQLYEFENDNKPDYIGYHLSIDRTIWFQTRTTKMSFTDIQDISIATDGIHTFKNFDGKSYPKITDDQIMDHFFSDTTQLDNSNKLKKSLLHLKEVHGLMPSDDLTIIRLVR